VKTWKYTAIDSFYLLLFYYYLFIILNVQIK